MVFNQKGFSQILIILSILIVAGLVSTGFYLGKRVQQPKPSPIVTTTPEAKEISLADFKVGYSNSPLSNYYVGGLSTGCHYDLKVARLNPHLELPEALKGFFPFSTTMLTKIDKTKHNLYYSFRTQGVPEKVEIHDMNSFTQPDSPSVYSIPIKGTINSDIWHYNKEIEDKLLKGEFLIDYHFKSPINQSAPPVNQFYYLKAILTNLEQCQVSMENPKIVITSLKEGDVIKKDNKYLLKWTIHYPQNFTIDKGKLRTGIYVNKEDGDSVGAITYAGSVLEGENSFQWNFNYLLPAKSGKHFMVFYLFKDYDSVRFTETKSALFEIKE